MGQQINVKSKSEGENEGMPENFTLYARKSPRRKKFVTNLDDYPKFIKLVKSPPLGRRHEAMAHEQIPPHLIPQPISLSYPSTGTYFIQPEQFPRYSDQRSPRVAYIDWVPQHRIPNYQLQQVQDPRNNLYKSRSFDGYTQNLAHIPLVRRNSQYFVATSPHNYLINDKNIYSRNTYNANVAVGNREVPTTSRNSGPSQENSAPTSHQSTASSRKSTNTDSEFYYPRELDVETIDRFQDANGRVIRVVKPIGSSTRIFDKTKGPQMFMIVDNTGDIMTQSSPGRLIRDDREDRGSRRSNRSEDKEDMSIPESDENAHQTKEEKEEEEEDDREKEEEEEDKGKEEQIKDYEDENIDSVSEIKMETPIKREISRHSVKSKQETEREHKKERKTTAYKDDVRLAQEVINVS